MTPVRYARDMTEHDDWARDFILDAPPLQIASALISLADEVKLAETDAQSLDDLRQVGKSQAWARLAALANATSQVEWQSSQVMFTLARRAAELKTAH